MSADGTTSVAGPRIVAFARPERYATTGEWLKAGLRRQRPAVIGALLAAWTGLAFALWFALGGAILGALVGAVGSTSLGVASEVGANTGTGVIAVIIGAITGAAVGLAFIYVLFVLHPLQLLGALASGIIVTTLFLVFYFRAEPLLMRMRGYREPSRREKALIHPLLIEAASAMNLPVVPAVWISDQQKPGAWAHMRALVLTRGLLGDYDASERPPHSDLDNTSLLAILAHELHHWDSADVVGLSIVTACFCPLVAVINIIGWIRERGEWLGILLWVIFWPVWVASKLVVVPLMARRSRQHEYDADAAAASLGDPIRLGLRRALDELSAWEVPRTGWENVLAATHPPIEHRLELLEAGRVRETAETPAPTTRSRRPRATASEPEPVADPEVRAPQEQSPPAPPVLPASRLVPESPEPDDRRAGRPQPPRPRRAPPKPPPPRT